MVTLIISTCNLSIHLTFLQFKQTCIDWIMHINFVILDFEGSNIFRNPQKWHIQLTISIILSQMLSLGTELKEEIISSKNTRIRHAFFIFPHGNVTLHLAHLMT